MNLRKDHSHAIQILGAHFGVGFFTGTKHFGVSPWEDSSKVAEVAVGVLGISS